MDIKEIKSRVNQYNEIFQRLLHIPTNDFLVYPIPIPEPEPPTPPTPPDPPSPTRYRPVGPAPIEIPRVPQPPSPPKPFPLPYSKEWILAKAKNLKVGDSIGGDAPNASWTRRGWIIGLPEYLRMNRDIDEMPEYCLGMEVIYDVTMADKWPWVIPDLKDKEAAVEADKSSPNPPNPPGPNPNPGYHSTHAHQAEVEKARKAFEKLIKEQEEAEQKAHIEREKMQTQHTSAPKEQKAPELHIVRPGGILAREMDVFGLMYAIQGPEEYMRFMGSYMAMDVWIRMADDDTPDRPWGIEVQDPTPPDPSKYKR